jgi:phosphomannomutase
MTISKEIFRKYDIRGIYDKDLTLDAINLISHHLVLKYLREFKKDDIKIVIGFDGRVSSKSIFDECSKTINALGFDVVSIGLCCTPMLYFASKTLNADIAIMITGSHNPPEWNGLKILFNNITFYDKQIEELYQSIVVNNDIANDNNKKVGIVKNIDISQDYINKVLNGFDSKKKLKICFDCGNGATGVVVPQIADRLSQMGHITHILYDEVDGTFPNHHPDPTVEKNMLDVAKFVRENDFDIGVAFDGDGDRVGFVDNKGSFVYNSQFAYLMAVDVIENNHNASVVFDVKSSKFMIENLKKLGGEVFVCKTGHTFIKAVMRERGAIFGAEASGHICFGDRYYGFDDGVYSGIRFLQILENKQENLSEILAQLPSYKTTGEVKIFVSNKEKFEIIEKLQQYLTQQSVPFNSIDGLRVEFDDRWFLIRTSNTQDCVIIICEGLNDEALNTCKNDVNKLLQTNGFEFFVG